MMATGEKGEDVMVEAGEKVWDKTVAVKTY